MKLPIFNNREIVGFATSIAGAQRHLRKILSINPRATLHVWRRTDIYREINDAPDGFVYAIAYHY